MPNVVVEAKGAPFAVQPSLYGAPSYTNSLTFSNDLTNAAWNVSGTPSPALDAVGLTGAPNTATTLTDNDGAGYEYLNRTSSVSISADAATHTLRVFIKKDADTSRFPEVAFNLSGGTTLNTWIGLNTSTGETAVRTGTTAGTYAHEANLIGDWWELLISRTNNSTNTAVNTNIYPAMGTTIAVANAAATGSIIVGNVELHLNKTIAQVRGSSPIVTADSTVTTTAISMSYDIANHSDTQGAYYAEFVSDDYAPATGIVSTFPGSEPIFYNADRARTYSVGTGFVVGSSIVDGSTVKAGVAYGEQEGSLNIITDGSVGTAGTSFAGFRNNLARIDIGSAATVPVRIRNIRRYNLNYTAAVAKLVELTT